MIGKKKADSMNSIESNDNVNNINRIDSIYKDLYRPLPDADQYLKRIGHTGDLSLNTETLNDLIYAHLLNVPFEGLDIFEKHTEPDLGIEAIYNKIVLKHRGGYCFELNSLFMSLLQAIGFTCHAVMARVVWQLDPLTPPNHRATVTVLHGVPWLCDVGFGGPGPAGALRLDQSVPQTVRGEQFRIEISGNAYVICRETEGNWTPILVFRDSPMDPIDFLPLNGYHAKHPNSRFLNRRRVNLRTENGYKAIDGDVLRIKIVDEIIEEEITDKHVLEVILSKHFGIVL